MAKKPKVSVSKSYAAGHVSVRVDHREHSMRGAISSTISVDIDLHTARELAVAIQMAVDKEADKVAAEAAHEERRKKYRDREIAAGRMQVFTRL